MKFRAIELFFGIVLLVSTTNAYTKRTQQSPGQAGTSGSTCPDGSAVNQECEASRCPDGQLCYRAGAKKVCCEKKTFCDMTGMYSYFQVQSHHDWNTYQYQYDSRIPQSPFLYEQVVDKVDLSPGCPLPVSLLFKARYDASKKPDIKTAVLPVEYKGTDQAALTQCQKNSDCGEKEFCGDVYNPSDHTPKGHDEQNIKFCYHLPKVPNLPAETKFKLFPDQYNLIPCNNHEDCYNADRSGSSFCVRTLEIKEFTFYNYQTNEIDTKKGLCMTSEICVEANKPPRIASWAWAEAGAPFSINVEESGCSEDIQCGDGGRTDSRINRNKIVYDPICIKDKAYPNLGVCCYGVVPQCSPGMTETPKADCGVNTPAGQTSFEECNSKYDVLKKQQGKAIFWCDHNLNVCCKDDANKLEWCDDDSTPLFNEPLCTEYDPSIETSGNCPQQGATCKYGHCCPKVKTDATTGNKIFPTFSYTTNYPCTPGERPAQFNMGYCDPETEKVVIIGEKSSKTGDIFTPYPRENPTGCIKDSECSKDNSTICIFKTATGQCHYNPMLPLQRPANSVWMGVLITSIILAFVFMATSICCMVLYRSKSVFDKYKPSKKKGGAKKGGGSKSKSSKKSKEAASETKSVTESKKSVMQ